MSSALSPRFFDAGGTSGPDGFPNPFMDIASTAVPHSMRNTLYWCVLPGAPVELGDTSLRLIEDVAPGDLVLTRGGTVERVLATSALPYEGDAVSLCFEGLGKNQPLRLTGDHRLWRISTPKLKPNRVAQKVTLAASEKVHAREVQVGDYVATPLPRWRGEVAPSHPAGWPEDKARFPGWLFGLYLAEGCALRNNGLLLGARFTLSEDDEKVGILDKALEQATETTGSQQKAYTPPQRPNIRLITVHDPEFPSWCIEHGGELSQHKQLSPALLAYGEEFLLQVLAGHLDGDGWLATENGRFYGAYAMTSCQMLAFQLQRYAHTVGLTPSLSRVANDKGYGTDGAVSYALYYDKHDCQRLVAYSMKLQKARAEYDSFTPKTAGRMTSFVKDGYIFRRVTEVTPFQYVGTVHNLEVENDHSFVVGGTCVANCEYIFSSMGTYRMAMERIISYFLTDIEFSDGSDEEQEKFGEFFDEVLDFFTVLQNMLRDRMAYGNGFASFLVPFQRFLACPKCGSSWTLATVYNDKYHFNFEFSQGMDFVATCPRSECRYRGPFRIDDRTSDDEKKLKIRHWSPHEIELLHDPLTHDVAYLWRIPEDYKSLVRAGHLFHLERASKQVLEAIKYNQVFRFNDDVVFHMKEPTLSGIRNRGWGLPRILVNYRQIWYVQVLRRINEAIGLDYVIPVRVITPEARPGAATGTAGDPLAMYNGRDAASMINAMIRRRRRNPAAWQVLPFPVKYNLLGGEANQLAPRDLLDQAYEMLLNDAGTPVELYKGSLQVNAAPPALRLFEATWHPLVHDSNSFLRWSLRQVSQILGWEAIKGKMKRVTIADDIQAAMVKLQLQTAQQMSGTTAFAAIGEDYKKEQRLLAEEARMQAELKARIEQEMASGSFAQQLSAGQQAGAQSQALATAQGGQAQGGQGGQTDSQQMGPPPPVDQYMQSLSPNTPITPQDLVASAQTIAQDLLGRPEGEKDSQLRKLKQNNPVLHSLVRAELDRVRADARNQGGSAVLQQQFGAGGGASA